MTVAESIKHFSDRLRGREIDSPETNLELLLGHLLDLSRTQLQLNRDRILTTSEAAQLQSLVEKRCRRIPIQHLIGSAWFCGIKLNVSREVLIPRPETELLAERAAAYLRSNRTEEPCRVLDLGTGSGCLAIWLALELKDLEVHACDISESALSQARSNATCHGVEDRISFHASDLYGSLPDAIRFDLIISNPPYIPTPEIGRLQPEVRDHDPRTALDGGSDGLSFYRRIAQETPSHLNHQGKLMIEFGDDQRPAIENIFKTNNWVVESVDCDYNGTERQLTAAWVGPKT